MYILCFQFGSRIEKTRYPVISEIKTRLHYGNYLLKNHLFKLIHGKSINLLNKKET